MEFIMKLITYGKWKDYCKMMKSAAFSQTCTGDLNGQP